MKDTIYRQDAIDVALTFLVEYCGAAFDEDMQKMLRERLNALPSAQPEIIRCKDCKYYHPEVHMCEGWIKQHVFLIVNENMWCCAGEKK